MQTYRVARISANNSLKLSLLFLSDGSQANKIVCKGTVDDLKLAFVTLATAAAVEATPQKIHFFYLRAHLTLLPI